MRPYLKVGESSQDEVGFDEGSARLHVLRKAVGRTVPKVDEQLEDAQKQKRVAAFSYDPVPLNKQEEELVEVFEALGNVTKQGVGLVEHACCSKKPKEVCNKGVDLLLTVSELHETAAEPLHDEKYSLKSSQLQENIDESHVLEWSGVNVDSCFGMEERKPCCIGI